MVSFAIAGLWGTNYVALTKKMIGARLLHVDKHVKASEEASPDQSTESVPAAPSVDQALAASADAEPCKEAE